MNHKTPSALAPLAPGTPVWLPSALDGRTHQGEVIAECSMAYAARMNVARDHLDRRWYMVRTCCADRTLALRESLEAQT